MPLPTRAVLCSCCRTQFTTRRPRHRFCTKTCKTKYHNNTCPLASTETPQTGVPPTASRSRYPGLPSGTVGTIGEMQVAVDLLAKGYEVFRAVTPTASCDLAILKDGQLKRIEVRTGYLNHNGTIMVSKAHYRADHMAVVLESGIVYNPELEA